jgi:putative transcriptional regulator
MDMREQLREKIAGEITLSADAGKTIRKWREEFGVSQQQLARQLNVSPSVISDYESGRRKSPGIVIIRKIVDGLIDLDEANGAQVMRRYDLGEKSDSIISIKEFKHSVPALEFLEIIGGTNLTRQLPLQRDIHGFTIIDSMKAITSLSSTDYLKIYGWSSERALIFTGVKFGRSPMIAIRAHPLKPAMVCYHKPEHVDDLAIRLATLECIPLVKTDISLPALVERLELIE